ncbi:MAG: choice-of-anchor B family protein [Phycisphaeraceae bacterium]|nr:choice-of-anchor B family protein [Phycisphaeraceae bacterium]
MPSPIRAVSPPRSWLSLVAIVCLGSSHSLALPPVDDLGPRHDKGGGAPSGPAGGESYEAMNIVLKSRISLQEFDLGMGADCWGYTSPSGREYAIMTFTDGLAFVEVTDPASPVIVARFPTNGSSLWADAKVIGDKCYFIKDRLDTGLHVYDMGQIDAGVVTKVTEFRASGLQWAHNIATNEATNFVYLCGANLPSDGLVAIDVSNPAQPVIAGSYNQSYVHDAHVVTWPHPGPWQGREIAFCAAADNGIDIVDVTNKSSMTRLARLAYPGLRYSHQLWVDVERRILFHNDELDELGGVVPTTTTRVFDVSSLTSPAFLGSFTAGLPAIDHNLYIRDGFVYQANYRSGMRVFDTRADFLNPPEVGWIDTFPEDDAAAFDGAWSVFPYFPSGTVLISDINRGLFVVDPTLALIGGSPASFAFVDGMPDNLPQRGAEIRVRIQSQNGRTVDPATATLTYHIHPGDDGHGGDHGRHDHPVGHYTTLPLEPLGNDDYLGRFPALPCGELVHYYFTVESTDGVRVNWPLAAPLEKHPADVADRVRVELDDDFEIDRGWTVGAPGTPGNNATTGRWERAIPVPTQFAPGEDASDDGQFAFVTGNGVPGGAAGANDVDGGSTTLVSPRIDGREANGRVRVMLWFKGQTLDTGDGLFVSLSNDDGATWTLVESITSPLPGWTAREYAIEDHLMRSETMRVRFVAADANIPSLVEAGVDEFLYTTKVCDPLLPGDANNDGTVNFADLNAVLSSFGEAGFMPGLLQGDVNNDGVVNFADLNEVLSNFGLSR